MSSKSGKNHSMSKKTLKRSTNADDDDAPKKPKVTFDGLDGASVINSNDSLSITNLFRLADLHFNKKNYMFRHLYDSYNKFIEEDIKNFLEHTNHVFSETLTPTTSYAYWFKYSNVRIEEPLMSNGIEPLFPSDVRHNRLTYSIKLFANVTQYQDVIDVASDHKVTNIVGTPVPNYHIGTIPLMVRSKWCSVVNHKDSVRNECEYDPGGYFLVNGNEKVVISQDRMVDNKPLVFIKKDSGALSYVVQINSRSYKFNGMTQVMNVKLRKDGVMMIRVPILNEVNVCAVLRALGMESDKQIIDYITYDSHDSDMIDLIRLTLDACKGEKGSKISTQEEAIDYLLPKIRAPKKYTESDKETKQNQKKMYLDDLFKRSFLPHVEGNKLMKAFYLCYMLNRLLRASLGRIPVDDRDSYLNKRVDLPGDLMMELFKQQHKKVISDCKKQFDQKNKNDAKPINIISYIKASTIEQGFKASLSTGRWPRRQGVAQVLNRLSYLQTISFLRRVDAPGGDASSAKLTNPRHLHASSVGFLCCVTGDTEILMGDNATIKQIKDMKNGDSIMSTYKENLQEIQTPITNYFSRMPNSLLELTTLSGRTLKCTTDHPILTLGENGTYTMKQAGELTLDDKVIIRHQQQYINDNTLTTVVIKSSEIPQEYTYDLQEIGMLDKPISQEKLEILARLIGASVSDGHISKREKISKKYPEQYQASFHVGEEQDAYEIFDDINRLGFGTSSISRETTTHINKKNGVNTIHNTWKVAKGGAFAYILTKLGTFIGDKTTQIRQIPTWIMSGNKQIQREFLSGFMGGDGSRLTFQSNNNHFKLSLGDVGQTTHNDYLTDTIKYVDQICELLKQFGIESKTMTRKIEDEIDKTKVLCDISNSYENLETYANYIGYRYCGEKRRASACVIEYIKYKRTIANEKAVDYNTIKQMYKIGNTPSKIVNETGIEYHVVKRILENIRKGKCPTPRERLSGNENSTIKFDTFSKQYYLGGNHLAMPLKDIKNIKPELTYDFETCFSTHTLNANGFVTSNCSQTPEHAKVGLTKHLTLIGSLSIMSRDQYAILKDYLVKHTTHVLETPPLKLQDVNTYKVFLNGDWIGVTDKFVELYGKLSEMKLNNEFDHKNVSIVADHDEGEIRVYCDSGRMYRPTFVVNDNKLLITKEHIDTISLNKADQLKKITDFDEFVIKNPGLIEYVDMELQPYIMIADKQKSLNIMANKMNDSIELSKNVTSRHVDNRYDDMFYTKYSHCEMHPSLLIGEIIANIPFFDHNVGPRVIFAYAQGRQAMGIYATNYRDRMDISYILYHPQRPLVSTRTARYTNSELLPAGENCVVAIACYTGYNQEDSLIFNKTAIERGKFRGMYLKKYLVQVQKNQTTFQDDLLIKPDPNKTSNMKNSNVDKLNEKGYAPEETRLENGDVIFGKVTQVTDPNAKKPYRDSSEIYKMHTPGVVDRMYIDIPNADGYLTREALIRCEKYPRIGDKYSCYDDQTEILTERGWILFKDLTMEDKVATLINGNNIVYSKPSEIQQYDFDGNMYKVKSNHVDLLVTPNHGMWVKPHGGKKFRRMNAEDIDNKIVQYKKNAENFTPTIKSEFINENKFILPSFGTCPQKELDLNAFLEFFGIWVAEGCASKDKIDFSAHKPRVKQALDPLCTILGYDIRKYIDKQSDNDRHKWCILDKQLSSYFEKLSVGAINKTLPDWVWSLNTNQCKILINGMVLGDGHYMKNTTTERYDTSSIKLADDFQRLCLHAGYCCNIALKYEAGHSATIQKGSRKGEVITSTKDAWRMSVIKTQTEPKVNKYRNTNKQDSWEHYNGKVYCCTVNDDTVNGGIVYVRRNGIPIWSCNSRHGKEIA
jgi:DNA-directed RNA polymerase beta subunit/intein/homing endonuclease